MNNTIENTIKNAIENAKNMLDEENKLIIQKQLALLSLSEKLLDFPFELNISFGYGSHPFSLDFDSPPRETVVALLKRLQVGTWTKELQGSTEINYINKTAYPFALRIYAAEPPETCRIIREVVEIPETLVPAHRTTKFRMECNPV